MNKKELRALIANGHSYRQIAEKLGASKSNVRYWCAKYGLTSSGAKRLVDGAFTSEAVIEAVAASTTAAEAIRRLGRSKNGGSYTALKKAVERLGLSTAHWVGLAHRKGCRQPTEKVPLADVMVEGSSYSRGSLKRRLLDGGILTHECNECGQGPAWRGKPLVLVLDHINGVNNDHRMENLQILCPNCNSQTPTFAGRNVKR